MSGWKAVERAVAALVDGTRTWDDRTHADVRTDDGVWAIEVKHRKIITGSLLEEWIEQAERNAGGAMAALVVKRKAPGRRPTPYLAIFRLTGNIIEGEINNGAV